MGYKCPACRKDFGDNESKLHEHFKLSKKCSAFGDRILKTLKKQTNENIRINIK